MPRPIVFAYFALSGGKCDAGEIHSSTLRPEQAVRFVARSHPRAATLLIIGCHARSFHTSLAFQSSSQHQPRSMQARGYRSRRTFQNFGSLGITHLLEIAQNDHLPVLLWQNFQGFLQTCKQVRSGQVRQQVCRARQYGLIPFRPIFGERFVEPAPIHSPAREIPRNAKQIPRHRTLRGIVTLRIADQLHEYFLRDVFRRGIVAAHMPGEPENGSLILLVESAKSSLVPLRELPVQIPVTIRFFHRAGRGIHLGSYSSLHWTRKTIQYLLL